MPSVGGGTGAEPLGDPGGVASAIDRYRDLAKYLIAIIAAVGATLVAGTQLSSIGELSWSEEPGRTIAACAGLAFAVAAVAWTVAQALEVLRPIEMSLEDVIDDEELRADVDRRESLLAGAGSVGQLRDLIDSRLVTESDRKAWLKTATGVVRHAAYRRATKRFERAWRGMLAGGLVGFAGIVAFAWGANPPQADRPAGPSVGTAPQQVAVFPTPAGRQLIEEAAGCTRLGNSVRALAVGGSRQAPEVVTLPRRECRPVRLTLVPSLGTAISPR